MAHQTKVEKIIKCHAWVNDNRVVCGTKDSKILVIEGGDLILEMTYQISTTGMGILNHPEITAIASYSTGILVGLDNGLVVLFRKTEDSYLYSKTKEISLENSPVHSVTFSPHDELAIVNLNNSQLYKLVFEGDSQNEEVKLDRLCESFHSGSINAIDSCLSKPLFVTCGSDQSIRIWNYLDNTIEVVAYCDEAAISVAMHPNGLYILAAFPTSLKLMAILIDDIRPYWESNSFRNCKQCRFSHGGHLFAIIWNLSITICNSWSMEIVSTIRFGATRIDHLEWSSDDTKILVFSQPNAVTVWDVSTGTRAYEISGNNEPILSTLMAQNGRTIFTYTGEMIKVYNDGNLQYQLQAKKDISHLFFSHFGDFMLGVDQFGMINVFKFPFDASMKASEHFDVSSHASAINRICFSGDDQHFFTIGDDGCVFIYKIQEKDSKPKFRRELIYTDEILVSRSDLAENQRIFNELKAKVENLKQQSDSQLKAKDLIYSAKLQEIVDKYQQEITDLKNVIVVRKEEIEKSEIQRQKEKESTILQHELEIKEITQSFQSKYDLEKERYKELLSRLEAIKHSFELRKQETESNYVEKVKSLTEYYTRQLELKSEVIEQTRQEFSDYVKSYETNLADIEHDIEREIVQIEFKAEMKLKEEHTMLKEVEEENKQMKTEYDRLIAEIEIGKKEITKAYQEEKRVQDIIRAMEHDMSSLHKELQEREETLLDKEKRIIDLKKKNQELEKFRFVLDFKIVDLKKQVQPREEDIVTLSERIKEMSAEIDEYATKEKKLKMQYEDLILKHFGSLQEMLCQNYRNKFVQSQKVAIEQDLAALRSKGTKERSKMLIALHHKYLKMKEAPESAPLDQLPKCSKQELLYIIENIGNTKKHKTQAIANEFDYSNSKQRILLQKTIHMLEQQLEKDALKGSQSAKKMIKENITLTS